jgi:hypothetical protein
MRLAYHVLLHLLPSDFRAAFGGAMTDDFTCRLHATRARGLGAAAWLTVGELLSLLGCAASEWVAKATAPPFQRDMIFRDRSRMRPPGASKTFWYGDL